MPTSSCSATATFIYCLIVDGTVRENLEFVPQLSTAAGILLGVVDIAVLIFFIHHVATSIRVDSVVANLTDDLRDVIEKLFPSELGERPADPYEVERAWKEPSVASRWICSRPSGYIRHIDDEMLMSAARADVAAGTETNRVRGLTPSPAQRPVSSCGAVTGFDSGEPR